MTYVATWKGEDSLRAGSRIPTARDVQVPKTLGVPCEGRRPVRLTLFGGIHLYVGDREIALKNRKAKALIAYLVLTPKLMETRDRLTGLLWSQSEESRARASLRQLLHVLREALDHEGIGGLSADKLQVNLAPGLFANELESLFASIELGCPSECLLRETRITETLLYGYDDVDPSFAYWLEVQRESLRQRMIRALEAQLLAASASPIHLKHIARALFQIDPTHELACQALMRAYVETGDIAGALVVYRRLWEHLEQDHDVEPSRTTQEIVVAIKRGVYRPGSSASSALCHPVVSSLVMSSTFNPN